MVLRDLTFEELVKMTRSAYDVQLIVGEDLMSFQIADEISIVMRRGSLRTQ